MGIQFYENCLKKAVEFKEELDEAKVQTGYGRVLTNIKVMHFLVLHILNVSFAS